MPEWLGDDWSAAFEDHVAKLPPVPGARAVVELVVSGGPSGERRWHWRYDDGAPTAASAGAPAAPADVTFTVAAVDARALLDGSVEPGVAFMRGRLKTAGDPGLVLRLLAATAQPAYQGWRADLAATTSF